MKLFSQKSSRGSPFAERPWKYDYSLGQTFQIDGSLSGQAPLLFTKFETREGRYVARVPFSECALWEIRALASEAFVVAALGGDIVTKSVRINEYKGEVMRLLYSPETLEYAVAVHCFANTNSIEDFAVAAREASNLAGFVLNLPGRFLYQLADPKLGSIFSPFHKTFLENEDRGYVYWCLCQHSRGIWRKDSTGWLDETLLKAGLPRVDACLALAAEELRTSCESLPEVAEHPDENDLILRLREILTHGAEVHASSQTWKVEKYPESARGRRKVKDDADDRPRR